MHFLLSILISVASLNTLPTCRNIFFHDLICCSLLLPFLKPGYISLILISLIFLATILSPIQENINQSDGKFNEHIRSKLVKANKCLHVLRTLRKEHYSQAEIDHLFMSIVLPNFSYALSVYGASESDLAVIQKVLDRCHKRRFISFPVFIKNRLNKQDRNILKNRRIIFNNYSTRARWI